jgi:hypothetical protein
MNLEDLSIPLTVEEIDFRIQSINKGGYATILAYKDARVDINRLNTICGRLGWSRSHSRENQNCTVSIWDEGNKHWVSKEDTGTESFTEAAKGLASDSFKRACFNWGIGIELYDYPVISVKLNQDEFKVDGNRAKQTWNLKLKDWVWRVDHINSNVTYIACKDQKGEVRFSWGSAAKKSVTENKEAIQSIISSIANKEISVAAESWFGMSVKSRKDMYVSQKHGGPFSPPERSIMQDEFINHYQGDNYEGLFSFCED